MELGIWTPRLRLESQIPSSLACTAGAKRQMFLSFQIFPPLPSQRGPMGGLVNAVWCPSHLWDKSRARGAIHSVCPLPPLPGVRWGFACWRGPLGHWWHPQHGILPEECTRGLGKASAKRQDLAGGTTLQSQWEGFQRDQQGQGRNTPETACHVEGPGSSSGCPWYPDVV